MYQNRSFVGGKRFVIAVLKAAGNKRWIFVEHVLQPKREGGVTQPGAPSTWLVFRCRNWHDTLSVLAD